MTALLLDTHAWVWALLSPEKLSARAAEAIAGSEAVIISPISLFEVAQKVRLGKWPELAPHLEALASDQETRDAPLTRQVARLAGLLDWTHRDPFDRLLGATAIEAGLPLVSKDAAFDALAGHAGWRRRIWD